MYAVRNYEYTYGYTQDGQIYLDEYFPNTLELLYRGKSASLYVCDPESTESTQIPNEAVCDTAVPVLSETFIPDALEALSGAVGESGVLQRGVLSPEGEERLVKSGVLKRDETGVLRWIPNVHAPRPLDSVKPMLSGDWYE
jgi:hypothetical protein